MIVGARFGPGWVLIMPSVFLSYARRDLSFALKLEQALQNRGISVWRDQKDLGAGDLWAKKTGDALASSDQFVLVWSQEAARSSNVTFEWNAALNANKRIIPIFVDDTPLPPFLLGITAVDGRALEQAVAKIEAAIRSKRGPSPPPVRFALRSKKTLVWAGWVATIAVALWRLGLIDGTVAPGLPTVDNVLNLDGVQIDFVEISAGSFEMGSESGDEDERPVRRVKISRGFQLGKFEVTQRQWEAVMGSNPSHFRGPQLPVEQVSWDDVQAFFSKLNALGDGWTYRLPTEAEWEYAAHAGSSREEIAQLQKVAWYRDNSNGGTHPVGQREDNAWGLFDMHGNVAEWVQDWYQADYSSHPDPESDPEGPPSGSHRIMRGGGWNNPVRLCRSANRGQINPNAVDDFLGFRILRRRAR